MKLPKLGWTTKAKVQPKESIHDGDTLKITVERTFTIRMLGDGFYYDTAEISGKKISKKEKEEAKLALKHLISLLFNEDGTQKDIVIHIDGDPSGVFANSFCIGTRALAHVWADGVDVTEEMNKAGFLKKSNYE